MDRLFGTYGIPQQWRDYGVLMMSVFMTQLVWHLSDCECPSLWQNWQIEWQFLWKNSANCQQFPKCYTKKKLICSPSVLNTNKVVSPAAPNSILTVAADWLRCSYRSVTDCSPIFRLSEFMVTGTGRVTWEKWHGRRWLTMLAYLWFSAHVFQQWCLCD